MSAGKNTLASRAGAVVRRAVKRAGTASEAPASNGSSAKKAPAKKTAVKKQTAKKAPAKKASAAKAPAKKTAAKKQTAKKAPAKKASAAKAPAKKQTAEKASAKKAPAKKAPAKKASATKAPAAKVPAKRAARRGSAAALVVRPGESAWSTAELSEVRAHLRADVVRLEPELEHADSDLHDLMIDSGDGSGQDQADMGSSTFERDHELSIANNAREMLDQSRHALDRIDDGTYGVCEGCGEPIGKLRLMAFPRATLCMTCKQREERR